MDLISREAAIEAIKELLYEPDSVQYIWSSDALSAVKHVHSVPAVPLDKLCALFEWADIVVPCVLCEKIMPGWCERVNGRPITWYLDKAIQCPSWKEVLTALRKNETEERKDAK